MSWFDPNYVPFTGVRIHESYHPKHSMRKKSYYKEEMVKTFKDVKEGIGLEVRSYENGCFKYFIEKGNLMDN